MSDPKHIDERRLPPFKPLVTMEMPVNSGLFKYLPTELVKIVGVLTLPGFTYVPDKVSEGGKGFGDRVGSNDIANIPEAIIAPPFLVCAIYYAPGMFSDSLFQLPLLVGARLASNSH